MRGRPIGRSIGWSVDDGCRYVGSGRTATVTDAESDPESDPNRWFLDNHDHLQGLGIAILHQEEGSVRLTLPYDESLANPGTGVLQGGVVATLIDHAGGAAIRTVLEEPLSTPHASTDLNVTYLRPATADLTADATVVKAGRSMGVVEVEVTADTPSGERRVAVGRVTLHLDRESE